IRSVVRNALTRSNDITSQTKDVDIERNFLGPNKWQSTYNKLSNADKAQIDSIIQRSIPSLSDYAAEVRRVAEEIRKKPQVSFFFLTKQRSHDKPDDYMAEAIVDLGMAPRWNLTLNAAFMYKDNKMAKDSKGGKATMEMQFKLTQDKLEGRMPLVLTVAGDG